MPSFDIVSEIDNHELANAVDQANREIGIRFDFKGTNSRVEQNELVLSVHAPSDFQVKQVYDILVAKLVKREIDIKCLDAGDIEMSGQESRQTITIRAGIDKELARKIVKQVKEMKRKVQAAIQGEQVRITGKKRDDLQAVMAELRGAGYDMPLQFNNFRD